MHRISFLQNPNGKLFADTFGDVRLYDPEKHLLHEKLNVYYKGIQMGTVEVVSIRIILFKQITDQLAQLTWGKPAPYMAGILKQFYSKEAELLPDTEMAHLVLQWTSRNIEAHTLLITEWWQTVKEPAFLNSKQ